MRLVSLLCAWLLAWGCSGEELDGMSGGGTNDEPSTAAGKFNAFLKKEMTDIYFWADNARERAAKVPLDTSSQLYFNALKSPSDPWSRLAGEAFEGELASTEDGRDTGFGWIVTIWGTSDGIKAKINYIYPGSPADEAGLQRGDVIMQIDGQPVASNYLKLFNMYTGITVQVKKKASVFPRTFALVPHAYDVNPIAEETVLQYHGKKIGYLYYTSFVYKDAGSLKDLTATFTRFKQAGVEEFILDLRYNGGGYLSAAIHLASLLAPGEVVAREEVLINKTWNAKYQQQFEGNDGYLAERFDNEVPEEARLGLPRLWVLTSRNTASASEIVISGLKPYMQVLVVGDTTTGKNAGGSVFAPTDDKNGDKSVYLITMQYTNKNKESVEGGIPRTYGYNTETFYRDTTALGDLRETFVAIVLEKIAGDSRGATLQDGESNARWRPVEIVRPARLIVDHH